MHIKHIVSQYRRDFPAVFECEHCTYTEKKSGYDDEFFHVTIIPEMKCAQCHKKLLKLTCRGRQNILRGCKYDDL